MSQITANETTFASGRYSKRKRTQVTYHMDELEFSDFESDFENVQAKKRKTTAPKPLPKSKTFPFMKLPAELRNMIYNHVLADPSGIHLAAAFKKRRRTVERVSVELESHCAQPHYCDPLKAADNIRNQLEEPTVLLPALLAVSKQTYFEGRQILYSNEFTFTDSHALYCFLINLGPTGAKQLKSLRLKNWGYGRTLKTYNHACFAVLNWATELEAFRIDTTYRDTSNPKLAADQLYRDAFSWLEAFGMAKGKFDAGVDVLQLQSNCAVSHADNEEQFFESLRELLRIRQQTIMGKTGGQMKRKKTVKEVDV